MLSSIPTTPKALENYRALIGDDAIDEILELAAPLKGARVLHVNSTPFGGGVAEILSSFVPLMANIGLAADWQVIRAGDDFFRVTKEMHNSLQGMLIDWTPQMWEIWLQYNRINAEMFDEDYDFVVIHDPQPAAILSSLMRYAAASPGGQMDLALPHRPDRRPGPGLGHAAASRLALRRGDLHAPRLHEG